MPKNPYNEELEQILMIVRRAPDGMSTSEIEAQLKKSLSRRTLQRRLHELIKQNKITQVGEKRAVRYFIAEPELLLPFSKAALELNEIVRQPIQKRKPVGYQKSFLYDYQPNKTFYLSDSELEHLKSVGQQFRRPLEPGTLAKRILHRLLIDLSWNSSRLEGNTYSLLETERLIEYGTVAEGRNAFESQMILNHKEAIEFMVSESGKSTLDKYTILNIHALLSNGLLSNPKARGQLRRIPVGIGKTVYLPPEIPQNIEECFFHLVSTAGKIKNPFEQAFFLMVQLPYLQPFEDVNKRVSRISANIPLIRDNLSPLSFIDVPQDDYISGLLAIYELNRVDLLKEVFLWAYERSSQQYQLVFDVIGEPNLIAIRFRKELREIVRLIVTENIRGKDILEIIDQWSKQHISQEDQDSFKQLVETEVASLHEGNIAIYQIDLKTFRAWSIK